MKKIIYPLILVLVAALIILNYYAYKSPKINKIITQSKSYTILNEQNLYVNLYSNHNSPFHSLEAIEAIYLEDISKNNRWPLEVITISKETKYEYLKEAFTNYLFCFSLPKLTTNVEMEEAYLKIILKNGLEKSFFIGSFNFYYQEESNLNLVSYYATKKEHLLEIETLTIKLDLKEALKIINIKVGSYLHYYDQTLDVGESIVINLPTQSKIVDSLSVVISYQILNENYLEVLPYFTFFENFENPLNYSLLNNVYVID